MFFIIMTPLMICSFETVRCVILTADSILIVYSDASKSWFATFYKENGCTEICYKNFNEHEEMQALQRREELNAI